MARLNSNDYAVVWPRSAKSVEIKPLAKRLDGLDGKTIAFLWDDLFRGDEIWPIFKGDVVFDLLEEGMKKRYPGIRFVSWRTFGSTHGGNEREVLAKLPERLKELGVDAVVSGMAC